MKKKEKLNNKQFIILAGGLAAVIGGAYFLSRGLKSKTQIIVQYMSDADEQAANVIKQGLNPQSFIRGFISYDSFTLPLIMVGGGQANATFATIQLNLNWPNITEADAGKGFIFTGFVRGIAVWGIAGWDQESTMKAAQYVAKNGLPTQSIEV